MARISDEIRNVAYVYEVLLLYKLADRIDAEMVELPRDRDGMPIHVGDTVYDKFGDGEEETVRSITLTSGTAAVTTVCHGFKAGVRPADLTHTVTDSWERIADELDEWCDGADVDGDACEKPRDLAERIRKLAKEEDK